MNEIHIKTEERETGGRYVTTIDGLTAEMTYSRASPHLIIIDHTGVPDQLAGRGIATALAEYAVNDARTRGHKIVPLCPFMSSQMRKHPEWQDILQR